MGAIQSPIAGKAITATAEQATGAAHDVITQHRQRRHVAGKPHRGVKGLGGQPCDQREQGKAQRQIRLLKIPIGSKAHTIPHHQILGVDGKDKSDRTNGNALQRMKKAHPHPNEIKEHRQHHHNDGDDAHEIVVKDSALGLGAEKIVDPVHSDPLSCVMAFKTNGNMGQQHPERWAPGMLSFSFQHGPMNHSHSSHPSLISFIGSKDSY